MAAGAAREVLEAPCAPTVHCYLSPSRIGFAAESGHGHFRSKTRDIDGNKVVRVVVLLQKFLSRKKLSRKYRSIFGLKNQSCDRRQLSIKTLLSESFQCLCNQAHRRDNKTSKTTSRTILQPAPNTQYAARSTACGLDSLAKSLCSSLFY